MSDVATADFADFDAAFAEPTAKPKEIKLYGRVWELPATLPAAAVLKVTRYLVDGKTEHQLTPAEQLDLARDLIPADTLKAWTDRGIDIDQLGTIITWLMRRYMAGEKDGEGPGEAPAPAGAHDSSSPAGASSRLTSPATTGST